MLKRVEIITILKKKKFFLIAALVGLLFALFQYFSLTTLKFISMMPLSLFMIRSLPYKIVYVFFSLLIAVLIGVSVSLLVYQFSKGIFGKNKNIFGIFLGILSPVCITCLIGAVALLLSALGISLVAVLPSLFRLDELYFKFSVIVIISASVYLSTLKLRNFENVRMKEKRNVVGD